MFRRYEMNVRGESSIGTPNVAPNYEQAQMDAQASEARKQLFRNYEIGIRGETSIPSATDVNAVPEYGEVEAEERRQAEKEARQRMFKPYEADVRKDAGQEIQDTNALPDYGTSQQAQLDRAARQRLFADYENDTDKSPSRVSKMVSGLASTSLASKGLRLKDKLSDKLGKGKGKADD